MRGNCEELAPQYDRDVVCCSRCLLVQFVRSDERCRRCGQSFAPVALAVDKSDSSASGRGNVVPDVKPVANRTLTLAKHGLIETQAVNCGFAFRIVREAVGMSQKGLARQAGVPRTYYSKVECGVTEPTIESVEKFARACGVSVFVVVALATLDNGSDSGTMRNGRKRA